MGAAMISDNSIQKYKEIVKKETGEKISDAEATDQATRLVQFFEVLIEIDQKEQQRLKRLEKEPKGFHLDEHEGVYTCLVCHRQVSGQDTWWDKWGTKCLDCQRNIDEGVVPSEICKDRDLLIQSWDFRDKLGLHPSTVRKLRREGKIIGRDLLDPRGSVYKTIYLVGENRPIIESLH